MVQKGVLILGSDHHAALELIFSSELSKLGIRNEVLGIQNVFLKYYNKSILNKIVYRLGISTIESKIQVLIRSEVIKYKPQIVLVFKGMEIRPETIKWIKSKGIQIANYNPDNPFIFSGRGSGNKNVSNSISFFDVYFTYDRKIKNELVKRYVNTELIPFGFDCNGFKYKELKEGEEIMKLCFLGNADHLRVEFIQKLAKKGIKVDVYGENWSSMKLHSGITIFGPLYGKQFWKTLQGYAVQLNLLRPHNLTSHNMRSFDIPGAGGIMLAPRTEDHQTFFTENKEVFLFEDTEEAYRKIIYLLNLDFKVRSQIRREVRIKSITHHQYHYRVKDILNYIVKKEL